MLKTMRPHSKAPKVSVICYTSAIPLSAVYHPRYNGSTVYLNIFNPIALRKANLAIYNFGLSECNRVKRYTGPLGEPLKPLKTYILHEIL